MDPELLNFTSQAFQRVQRFQNCTAVLRLGAANYTSTNYIAVNNGMCFIYELR